MTIGRRNLLFPTFSFYRFLIEETLIWDRKAFFPVIDSARVLNQLPSFTFLSNHHLDRSEQFAFMDNPSQAHNPCFTSGTCTPIQNNFEQQTNLRVF